jgi:protein gp37
MAENTAIAWTDHTWNPWQGCHKVSPACDNCYMYREKKRYGQDPAKIIRSSNRTFTMPYRLDPHAPAKIFVCSWSDFFLPEADEWRGQAWEIIRSSPPGLVYQILTKRPENIMARLPLNWGKGWPNVWLGVTAENRPTWDERVSLLQPIPAAIHFVSYEPALGPLGDIDLTGIDWIICGGESGPKARPMHPDWARSIRDQCQEAGVPFFFKQWGEWAPFHGIPQDIFGMERVGKKAAGDLLDGKQYHEFPEVSK